MGEVQPTTLELGTIIDGRYRVLDSLGEGGMGTVYLAEHTMIRRHVAVKVMHADLTGEHSVIERFMNEARAAGTLGHPNIVTSTDMGFIDEARRRPYIVFEHLVGTSLTDEIYKQRRLPPQRVVEIAQQIASALGAAHASRIIHRDIKSDNVFLVEQEDSDEDFVKVLDFGISKFSELKSPTRRGLAMGTPEYMAPEQIETPDTIDHRVDIYALGVIMYEMLEGRRPFLALEDPRVLLHNIVYSDPAPLSADVPAPLAEIVNAMMSKAPDDRPQTAKAIEAALAPLLRDAERRSRSSSSRMAVLTPRPFLAQTLRKSTPSTSPVPVARSRPRMTNPPTPQAASTVSLPPAPRQVPLWVFAILIVAIVAVGGVVWKMLMSREAVPAIAASASVTPAPAIATSPGAAATSEPVTGRARRIPLVVKTTVPDARVTFRRRSSTIDEPLEIIPSYVVELVEVSAPGHKTIRYWLTLDRATTITMTLPKGDGLIEASELETLVALGEEPEGTAPSPVAAAAAKREPSSRKVEKPTPRVVATTKTVTDAPSPTKTAIVTPPPTKTAIMTPPPTKVAIINPTKAGTVTPSSTKPPVTTPAVTAGSATPPSIVTAVAVDPPPVAVNPPPPPVVSAPRTVPVSLLEGSRLAGERKIVPDDHTKVTISKAGDNVVVCSFKVCVAPSGSVQSASVLKASGYPSYDKAIQDAIRGWKFKPIVVEGTPSAACTVYAFQYTQR